MVRVRKLRLTTSQYWLAGYPHLLREWDAKRNDGVFPYELSYGSNRRVWWRCAAGPDHIWQARVASRVRGSGCPCCANLKVSVTNSLATLFPELATEWHPRLNGKLTPHHVVGTTLREVWWKCNRGPDHEWRAAVRARSVKGNGCLACRGYKVSVTNSLASLHPEVARQWHPTLNHPLRANQITAGSNRVFWWRCARSKKHDYRMAVCSRARGGACPYCAGHRVSHTNSLARRFPKVAAEWHPTKNADLDVSDVSYGSTRRCWWRCAECGNEWQATPNARTALGTGCPPCGNRKKGVRESRGSKGRA